MSLHPHNLAQKTEIMVEHFRAHTRQKIGGRAFTVRYFHHFRRYIRQHGYDDMSVLVAFLGPWSTLRAVSSPSRA